MRNTLILTQKKYGRIDLRWRIIHKKDRTSTNTNMYSIPHNMILSVLSVERGQGNVFFSAHTREKKRIIQQQ